MRAAIFGAVALIIAMASSASCSCAGNDKLTVLHPKLSATPAALSFSDTYVGSARTLAVTLSNNGTAPVSINEALLEGTGAAAFTLPSAPHAISQGQSIALTISYAPNTVGHSSAKLTIESNAEDHPTIGIALDGHALSRPSCDDQNACTDDSFDPDAGRCVFTARSGPCDDQNACTANDRCVDGACVGEAVACDDGIGCTRDVCDPAVGCAFIPDDSACPDDDPCSLDVCDPQALFGSGCTHPPAPDGSPCGAIVPCVTIDLCLLQVCTPFAIPDGSPCDDGDLCTENDSCTGGACTGAPFTAPPTVTSETFRLESPAALFDDAIVFSNTAGANLVPMSTLAPGTNLPAVVSFGTIVAEAGTHRFLSTQFATADGVATDTAHAILVDASDLAAPSIVFDHDLGVLAFGLAADGQRALLCSFDGSGIPLFLSFADGSVTPLTDENNACGAFPQAAIDLPNRILVSRDNVYRVDDDGLHVVAALTLPPSDGPSNDTISVGGGRIAITRGNDHVEVLFGDISDPTHPRVVSWTPPATFGDAFARVLPGPIVFPFAYFATESGPARVNVSDIDAPVVDAWTTDAPSDALPCLVDAQHVVLCPGDDAIVISGGETALSNPSHVFVTSTAPGTHVATPIAGTGRLDAFVSSNLLGVSETGVIPFEDATLTKAVPESDFAPLFAQDALITTSTDASLFTFGRLGDPGQVPPLAVALAGDGSLEVSPLSLSLPGGRDELQTAALERCFGAGVATCSDGSCAPVVVTLAGCDPAGALSALATVPLSSIDPQTLVTAVHHGTQVSLLGDQGAVLVDITDPNAPTAIEAPVPELADAKISSAAFVEGAWLIIAQSSDSSAPVRAVVFDVAAGAAARRFAFDAGTGHGFRSPAPAWLVDAHTAAVESSSDDADAGRGHSIVFYDLDTDPPTITATVPIADRAIGFATRPEGLVVARRDGITIVRPECP